MNKTLNCKHILITAILLAGFFVGSAQLSMKKDNDGIMITENGNAVFLYHTQPKNLNGEYERCNYIHPLYSIKGKVLTEDFPSDHLHHRGVFWAWHQVWIGDQRIGDPWEIKHFKQEVTEVEFSKHGSVSVVLRAEVNWLSDLWKKNGMEVPYLKENSEITVWPVNGNVRRIDFEIRLLALEEGLKLGGSEDEKGYGGFSVRAILPDDVLFTGPDGAVRPEETQVQSPGFINVSGSLEANNNPGGIVIVDHPDNPGYPQPWILRAKNSMQNAAWPGREPVSVSTTEPLVLKYSLLIYSGKLNAKKIEKIMQE